MLSLKLEDDEWIVVRDSRTKSEYARLTKSDKGNRHIVFSAPASTEIRRIKKDETGQ